MWCQPSALFSVPFAKPSLIYMYHKEKGREICERKLVQLLLLNLPFRLGVSCKCTNSYNCIFFELDCKVIYWGWICLQVLFIAVVFIPSTTHGIDLSNFFNIWQFGRCLFSIRNQSCVVVLMVNRMNFDLQFVYFKMIFTQPWEMDN